MVEPVSAEPVVVDTFAGRVHIEWDNSAPVTPYGQMPFFIDFVKLAGLFDRLVADCPVYYTRPNAPEKRDLVGTTFLSVLAGHWRYAHITALRCDSVTPPLLGMKKVVSEDDGVIDVVPKLTHVEILWIRQGVVHAWRRVRPTLSDR